MNSNSINNLLLKTFNNAMNNKNKIDNLTNKLNELIENF